MTQLELTSYGKTCAQFLANVIFIVYVLFLLSANVTYARKQVHFKTDVLLVCYRFFLLWMGKD